MAENKPLAHKVAMEKLVAVCTDLFRLRQRCTDYQVSAGDLETRGLAFAEILRDAFVPAQEHPDIARQFHLCALQVAECQPLCALIEELKAEFARTKVCPKCGTGLYGDGSCGNPVHDMHKDVAAVVG